LLRGVGVLWLGAGLLTGIGVGAGAGVGWTGVAGGELEVRLGVVGGCVLLAALELTFCAARWLAGWWVG